MFPNNALVSRPYSPRLLPLSSYHVTSSLVVVVARVFSTPLTYNFGAVVVLVESHVTVIPYSVFIASGVA
jgi:hypothetical protein